MTSRQDDSNSEIIVSSADVDMDQTKPSGPSEGSCGFGPLVQTMNTTNAINVRKRRSPTALFPRFGAVGMCGARTRCDGSGNKGDRSESFYDTLAGRHRSREIDDLSLGGGFE